MHGVIRNFHEVKPWLYRGGQPTREEIGGLTAVSIKTVICLRWGAKTIAAERRAVEDAGMQFVSLPLYYWRLPAMTEIDEFLELLRSEAARPIFVHCFHGADRTGLMIAMYRVACEGWSFEDAYEEMKRHGFHRFRLRHFKWILFEYAKVHSRGRKPPC